MKNHLLALLIVLLPVLSFSQTAWNTATTEKDYRGRDVTTYKDASGRTTATSTTQKDYRNRDSTTLKPHP